MPVRNDDIIASASRGPMPETAAISSAEACDTPRTEPKCFSSAARRAGPSPGTESRAETVAALPRFCR